MENYKKKIAKSFNSKSSTYEEYSLVQNEVSKRMIERLKLMKFKPKTILDLGSGTGYLSNILKQIFPASKITCLDISLDMLLECRKKNTKFNLVVADAENMPFDNEVFDLVISSFTLHWCEEIEKIFSDIHRYLKNKGVFMFTTVGPNTLIELNKAYAKIDGEQHVNSFTDMHIYGDSLLKCGFHDPVMDVENLIIEYSSFANILKSLRKTGANTVIGRKASYMPKESYRKLTNSYEKNEDNGRYPVTYEMIYGVSWKNIKDNPNKNTDVINIKKI